MLRCCRWLGFALGRLRVGSMSNRRGRFQAINPGGVTSGALLTATIPVVTSRKVAWAQAHS